MQRRWMVAPEATADWREGLGLPGNHQVHPVPFRLLVSPDALVTSYPPVTNKGPAPSPCTARQIATNPILTKLLLTEELSCPTLALTHQRAA